MRSVIMLCLMTLFCIADANISMIASNVQVSKETVQNCIRQLDRLLKNTERNTVFNIENQRMEQMQRYMDYSNSTIDAIRKEVEAAEAEGKDAQLCYNVAFKTSMDVQDRLITDSEHCVDTAESSIKSALDFINYLISAGRDMIKQLDKIYSTQYIFDTFNISQMESRIKSQLKSIESSMKNLQEEPTFAEEMTKAASEKIVLQGTGCLHNVYFSARSQVTEIRSAATKCLENL